MNPRLIAIVVGLVVVLGGAGVVLALSGSDDNDGVSTATPTSGSTDITIGIICTTPEDAARNLVDSWKAGDQAAARRCASAAVVADLFKNNGRGAGWSFEGCESDDPGVPDCAFRYEGGGAFFTMNGTEAEGWKATAVRYVAD